MGYIDDYRRKSGSSIYSSGNFGKGGRTAECQAQIEGHSSDSRRYRGDMIRECHGNITGTQPTA